MKTMQESLNYPGMQRLRSILVFVALLIPSAVLYRLGYINPAEPLTPLNYQLIIFLLPIPVFIILLALSTLARMRYKKESNDKLKTAKKRDFMKYRNAFLEVGWVFRDYASRIVFGLTIPLFLVVALLYTDPKNLRRKRLSDKEWILGLVVYPILFYIGYVVIKTGLAYTLLLFGPVSLLGLLKTWGDYTYFQMTYPSPARPIKGFQIETIGKGTLAETMYDEELGRNNVKGVITMDTKSEHVLFFDALTYYDAKSGKKPVTRVEKAVLDFHNIYQSEDLDLSFILSGERARPLIFEVIYEKGVSLAISRWAMICEWLYSVEIPRYETLLLKIDDVVLPLRREYTHYTPSILVSERMKAKYGFGSGYS